MGYDSLGKELKKWKKLLDEIEANPSKAGGLSSTHGISSLEELRHKVADLSNKQDWDLLFLCWCISSGLLVVLLMRCISEFWGFVGIGLTVYGGFLLDRLKKNNSLDEAELKRKYRYL